MRHLVGAGRSVQRDMDLARATALLELRAGGRLDEAAAQAAVLSVKALGRLAWPVRVRELLEPQCSAMLACAAHCRGLVAFPSSSHSAAAHSSSSHRLLSRLLDWRGRDLSLSGPLVALPHQPGSWLQVSRSSVTHPEAGFGVRVSGEEIPPGTAVAIYAGRLWWPGTYAGPPGNDYAISRYDGIVIDAHGWAEAAVESMLQADVMQAGLGSSTSLPVMPGTLRYRNPFAVGSAVNHPPPGVLPNVMSVMYDFPLQKNEKDAFIPHEFVSKKRPYFMFEHTGSSVPSMVLITTRRVKDEELFLNYRYNPALPYPDWYTQPFPEEAERRWAKHGIWN